MEFVEEKKFMRVRLDSAKRIIKSNDLLAFKCAKQIIADANNIKDEILAEAKIKYEEEKYRGYKEGREQAKFEQSANMIAIVSQTVDYFSKVEIQMVDLVFEAVRKIVFEYNDRERIAEVVKGSLALVRAQKMITLKVHPSQCESVSDDLEYLRSIFPTIEHINLASDASVKIDACVIESDVGKVESSMQNQLEALRSTMEKVFGCSSNTGGGFHLHDHDSRFTIADRNAVID